MRSIVIWDRQRNAHLTSVTPRSATVQTNLRKKTTAGNVKTCCDTRTRRVVVLLLKRTITASNFWLTESTRITTKRNVSQYMSRLDCRSSFRLGQLEEGSQNKMSVKCMFYPYMLKNTKIFILRQELPAFQLPDSPTHELNPRFSNQLVLA
jgi:hypothetical protein